MSFPKSFKTIEIMQEVDYGFTPEYVQELCDSWSVVKDYAWILHDKDVKEDGSLVAPHIHLMQRYHSAVPTSAILAKLSGVCEVQHLQKMHSWNSAIAYLTHSNRPEKYQYSDDEVHSNFEWQADREKALSKVNVDDIIERIANGEIREWNYSKFIPADVYVKRKQLFDNAWKYRNDKLQCEKEERLMKTDIMWLYGPAGNGKSEFAKYLCRDQGLEYYVTSSGSDPFGEYKGQRAIIIDDARPEQFDAHTLVKLLDPKTRSAVKSRYRNKWLECELIIITCPHSPEHWWDVYRSTESSAGSWEQLTRRLTKGSLMITREKVMMTLYTDEGEVLVKESINLPQAYYDGLTQTVSNSVDVRIAEMEAFIPGMKVSLRGTIEANADDSIHATLTGSIADGSPYVMDIQCEPVQMAVEDIDAIFDNSHDSLDNSIIV